MDADKKTKVFISYSHEDSAFARALCNELQRLGFQPWIDEAELLVGDSLVQKIGAAIIENDFVIAVVSPASIDSAWCQKELSLATTAGISLNRAKVLPVRLDCAAIPPYLLDTVYIDADRNDATTVAAELAVGMDRQLGLMTREVQQLVASAAAQPRRQPSAADAWSGVPWTITRGPLPVAPTGRDAVGIAWMIERSGESRKVIVWISGSAMGSSTGLPEEVVRAKRTQGRSVVEKLVKTDNPPAEVLAATFGIRLELPN